MRREVAVMAPGAQPRHWLITGVSGGLGRALAEQVLERGGVVVGTLRDQRQSSTFEALAPGRAFAVELDTTDGPDVLADRAAQAVRLAGHIDVLVNNAGYGLVGAVEEVGEDELRHQMDTNSFGPLRLIRALLPHLRARGRGHLVNISSIAGFRGQAGLGLYNASKFALEGLSEALKAELKPLGIAVTVVEPGGFRLAGTMRRFDGLQPGDPARGAAAIITAVEAADPPLRLPLGADAHRAVRGKLTEIARELDAWEHVSVSTAFESPVAG
ncbi:SDR family NAD(P)-dependent oxidoreductase [Amycolatopsis sp. NPDC026612]|uniref:SDR family NAD(P)-dependent oxidoreductase n=1 Tax=Amycolatopsis sp. NPDC026612 TaxID=3155466 RepID=UPI0033DA1BE3